MSFEKTRTPQNSPLKTFVSSDVSGTFETRQQSLYNYIPFQMDYRNVSTSVKKKLPSSFKCDSNLMNTPLDQGDCGSCWSFATCASLGDRINILCNKKIIKKSLSPTIPLSCNFFLEERNEELFNKDYVKTIVNLENILNNFGCYGNSVVLTCFFMHVWGTFDYSCASYNSELIQDLQYDRTNFGYRSSLYIKSKVNWSEDFNSSSCNNYFGDVGKSLNVSNCLGRIVNNQHIYMKPAQLFRALFYYSIKDSVTCNENIMYDIFTFGPITTTFRVYRDFYDFNAKSDGVYETDENPSQLVGGHAVCIVGWGEYKDPKTSAMIPFWWVKNSWGDDYGIKGYFRMRRGKNMCGIEENVVGIIPNTYPQSETELSKTMDYFFDKWKLKINITPSYLELYRRILKIYSRLDEGVQDVLYCDRMLKKYPIIDYFFFHSPFEMNYQLNPTSGYSVYNEYIFPGLDYSPPYTIKNMKGKMKI